MNSDRNVDSYKRFYTDMNFDRAGLFEVLKRTYDCSTVLYPGCSIHITPSFYFPHVIYVDKSAAAEEFFNDARSILEFVNSSKKYKQSAYIQFIHGDYTKPLPVREENYDLLISLYAGEISKSCIKYVKPGGIILTNNHHRDAEDALGDSMAILDAIVYKRGRKYVIDKNASKNHTEIYNKHGKSKRDMKNTSRGMEYVDNQCYFVLRKNK